MSRVTYYSGTMALDGIHSLPVNRFLVIGGKPSKHNFYNRSERYVGHPASGPDAILPVTRIIFFKKNPSLHKCDARCLNATGQNCECSCGGANHGAAA